jgi:hypothetical protein
MGPNSLGQSKRRTHIQSTAPGELLVPGCDHTDGVPARMTAVGNVDQLVADPQAHSGRRLEVLGQEAHKGVAGPGPVSVAVTVTVNRVGAGRARA